MRMVKKNAIKIISILTIMLCMEGGRTFAFDNHQIYCDFYFTDTNDTEISSHNHYFDSIEEESWNVPYSLSLESPLADYENQITPRSFTSQELSNSIWQPPKLV